jgi:hypothetical protein
MTALGFFIFFTSLTIGIFLTNKYAMYINGVFVVTGVFLMLFGITAWLWRVMP